MQVGPYEQDDKTKHLITYEVGDRVWCATYLRDDSGRLNAELDLWDVTDVSRAPRGSFVKIPALRTGLWVGVDGRPEEERRGWCPEGGWPDGSRTRLWSVSAWEFKGYGRENDHFGTTFVQADDQAAARERGLDLLPRVTQQHRDPAFAAYHRTTVFAYEIPRLMQEGGGG